MTLRDLLVEVEFGRVVPFILKHYPDMAHCMAGFKMAFDGMRNTMPACESKEMITVELHAAEGEEPYITAYHVDNDVWENVVGRKVIIKEGISASLEEIVAVILFEATYFGFTPTDTKETFEEWEKDREPPKNGNPYRIKWWHLTQKKHDSICNKEDIGKRTYTFSEIHHNKSMNRSKRKRAHRWEQRIEQLDIHANRWDLLQKIKHSVPDADLSAFEDLLYKVVSCKVHRREDFGKESTGLSYIYELLTQYDCNNIHRNADFTLLWIRTPNDVDKDALSKIAALFSGAEILQECSSVYERTNLTIVQLFNKDRNKHD